MLYLDLGRRELGKTTLAVFMAQRVPFRIILDPRGMVSTDIGRRVRTREELTVAIDAMIEQECHEIIVTPLRDIPGMFEQVCAYVYAWSQDFPVKSRALAFVIDEARIVNNARRPGDRTAAHVLETSDAFDAVLRLTPRELIHTIVTAHRPADIPTDIRAIADQWLLFRATQEHDLKVIRERTNEAVVSHVMQLQPHQFVKWNDATSTWQIYANPAVWFVRLRPAYEASDDVLPEGAPAPSHLTPQKRLW